MSAFKEQLKTTLVLDISTSVFFFKLLTIKAIENIFIKIGKLEKGCFNISREYFSDNSCKINFHYPTDMTDEDAAEFIDSLFRELKDMTLQEFTFILNL